MYLTPTVNLNVATHYGITMLPKFAMLYAVTDANNAGKVGLCCNTA